MNIREISNKEFNSFKSTINYNNIYQTLEYGLIMENQKYDYKIIGLINNEEIIEAACLLLIEQKGSIKKAYIPRGFIIDYNDFELLKKFTILLKNYLSKLNISSLVISPLIIKNKYDFKNDVVTSNPYFEKIFNSLTKIGYKHLGFNNFFENKKPRYEAILNLEKSYYVLFKNIKKEYRTKIRSAEKNGIEIYKGNASDLEYIYLHTKNKYPRNLNYFKDCYKYFSINKEMDFYYAKLNCEVYLKRCTTLYLEQENLVNSINEKFRINKNLIERKMNEDKILNTYKKNLVIATKYLSKYPEGIVIASALVVKNYKQVYLLIDGFDHNYKFLNAKHLLYWKLILKYNDDKFETFNFGGIANPNIESKFSGLNKFKIDFNSEVYEYIGDFELICNNKLNFINNNSLLNKIIKKTRN